MKSVIRRKFIALSAFIKKLDSFRTEELKVNLKAVEEKGSKHKQEEWARQETI